MSIKFTNTMTKFLDHTSVDKHTKMQNYGINIIMWLDAETYTNVSKFCFFFVFCVFFYEQKKGAGKILLKFLVIKILNSYYET